MELPTDSLSIVRGFVREAPPFLSFSGNRTIGFRRSKRESSSSRQELQVETKIGEFQQTPRGRVFSPTWFNPCLRVIQMA